MNPPKFSVCRRTFAGRTARRRQWRATSEQRPRADIARRLRDYGVRLFWVDAQVFYGLAYYLGFDFAVLLEFVQGRQRDEARVDLEEVAQRLAAFAAAETVGT